MGRGSRAHHIGLAVRPAHLRYHLLKEADLVIGDVNCNCRHIVDICKPLQSYAINLEQRTLRA